MSWRQIALENWGKWVCNHLDWADEYGESVIYQMSKYGLVDPQPNGANILCADMPPRIKKVDSIVNTLDELRKNCLLLQYCTPLKPNGHKFTVTEFSHILRINKGKFRAELRKAERQVKKSL